MTKDVVKKAPLHMLVPGFIFQYLYFLKDLYTSVHIILINIYTNSKK
jgi:hypothetical protein